MACPYGASLPPHSEASTTTINPFSPYISLASFERIHRAAAYGITSRHIPTFIQFYYTSILIHLCFTSIRSYNIYILVAHYKVEFSQYRHVHSVLNSLLKLTKTAKKEGLKHPKILYLPSKIKMFLVRISAFKGNNYDPKSIV